MTINTRSFQVFSSLFAVLLFTLSLTNFSAFAQDHTTVVANYGVNIRDEKCNVIGGAPFQASVLPLSGGTNVNCTVTGVNYNYSYVQYSSIKGYIASSLLSTTSTNTTPTTPSTGYTSSFQNNDKIKVFVYRLNLRDSNGTWLNTTKEGDTGTVVDNTIKNISISGVNYNFIKVNLNGQVGYVAIGDGALNYIVKA